MWDIPRHIYIHHAFGRRYITAIRCSGAQPWPVSPRTNFLMMYFCQSLGPLLIEKSLVHLGKAALEILGTLPSFWRQKIVAEQDKALAGGAETSSRR